MSDNNQDSSFIPLTGNRYERLKVYKIANCIYAITYFFANKFFVKGDRTIDQMIQAARSGKQNIAEGSVDGDTSKEMQIKLLNTARGSIHELKADYEDYLLTRGLEHWSATDPRSLQTKKYCLKHSDAKDYQEAILTRSDETIANIALTLIHQYFPMIEGLIERKKKEFIENGGIKEEMSSARRRARGY